MTAHGESESTLLSSRGVWEHLEVLRSTGEVAPSRWEDCVWVPDRFTFCSCWPSDLSRLRVASDGLMGI